MCVYIDTPHTHTEYRHSLVPLTRPHTGPLFKPVALKEIKSNQSNQNPYIIYELKVGSDAGGILGSSSRMSSGKPRRRKNNPGSLELSLSPLQRPTPNSAFPAWVDFPPFPAPFQLYLWDEPLGAGHVYLGTSGNVSRILEHLLTFSVPGLRKSRRGEMLSMLREERETNRFLLLNLATNTKFKNKLPGNLLV